jgi:16S rRNA (guanine527-N7)-methyltransferase
MRPRANLSAQALAEDRARALALTPVSRETVERLNRFVALLLDWQQRMNLVAPSTLPEIWTRHVADSLQLLAIAPAARVWVDYGSGAGFPGLPIACALAGTSGACVHLVESIGKKAAFLREAVGATGVPAEVHAARFENLVDSFDPPPDMLIARAVSPLKLLLDQTYPLLRRGTNALFPKGQDVEAELTEAARYWKIEAELVPSRTDSRGRIVHVRSLKPRGPVR